MIRTRTLKTWAQTATLATAFAALITWGCNTIPNESPAYYPITPPDVDATAALPAACANLTVPGPAPGDASYGPFPALDAGDASITFKPSNVDPAALSLTSVGDVTITASLRACTLNTDSGAWSCEGGPAAFGSTSSPVTLEGGGTALAVAVRSLTVDSGAVLTITGSKPLILFATENVILHGLVQASALGGSPGPGGASTPTAGSAANADLAGGAAGGGASFCGAGGAGAGYGCDGGTGTAPGAMYGTPKLVPLVAGSSGANHGASGYGGGAVQITAMKSIEIRNDGSVVANGSGGVAGSGGSVAPAPPPSPDGGQGEGGATVSDEAGSYASSGLLPHNPGAGGGGGSGGAILLEAQNVIIEGAVFANGGGGGDSTFAGASGYTQSYSALGGAGVGGAGAAGDGPNAKSGILSGGDHGGGGGGAGRIRINTANGPATISGAVSPSPTSGCASLGGVTL